MRRDLKIFIICMGVVIASLSAGAQQKEDFYSGHTVDVKIYFPFDKVYIDSVYMENHHSLNLIDSLLRDTSYISSLQRIEIMTQSSPEGRVEYNENLSQRRKISLADYFTTNYPHIDSSLWSFKAVAENWDLFRKHLVEDKNLPYRSEILKIVDGTRKPDDKEWLIKTMHRGRPWRYIQKHILPSQRFGASVMFIPLGNTPLKIEQVNLDAYLPMPVINIDYQYQQPIATQPKSKVLLAVRSNLIFDVASVVNLAVEVPLGNRFSIAAEVAYPWWRSWSNNLTMQIESYHGEFKYWLGKRTKENRLSGWSVGLYGGWGLYDVQPFSETGVQGNFFDVGLMAGYSHAIAKNLFMEYTLGVGYITTYYNDYYMAYDTEEFSDIKVIPYPWMNNKLATILPTRIAVSLVWHLNSKEKGGNK